MGSEVKLKEVTIKIGSGSTPRGGKESYLDSGDYRLIRSQNIYNHYFEWNGLAYISEIQAEKLKNVNVEKEDILINITGDSVARNMMATCDYLPARVNQHVAIIRCDKNKLDPYYLSAILTSKRMQQYLLSIAQTGGTRAALTKSMLENLEVPLLDLKKQKSIGMVLKLINNKIEINKRIILNLEQLAQTLFKRWFVDFEFPNKNGDPYKSSGGEMMESELGMIPVGWSVKKVGEVTKIVRGASPRPIKDYIRSSGMPWVKIADANASGSMYIGSTKEFIKEEGIKKSRIVTPGTLILSNSATPGIPKFMTINACVHDGWLIFDEYLSITKEYLFLFLTKERESILSLSNGSVFRNLKTDILKNYKIVIPEDETINRFQNLVSSIFDMLKNKVDENEVMVGIRDTLLPKLLSGEIELPEETEVIEDVPIP